MEKLELRNDTLESIQKLLLEAKLKGTDSRLRTRFVKILGDKVKEIQEEHLQLVKDYAILDEEGNPVIEDENFKIKEEDYGAFNKAYIELYSESFEFELSPENCKILKSVLVALEECDELSGEVALIHEYAYDKIENSLK